MAPRLPIAKKRRVRHVSVLWATLQKAVTPYPIEVSLGPNVSVGSRAVFAALKYDFRFASESGRRPPDLPCPFGADFVAEVR